jgi:acetyl/propionyl-CoA carboxylase alpha subunit
VKRIVNGVEVELSAPDVGTVSRAPDRLIVRSREGAGSAVAVRTGESVLVSYRGQMYRIEKPGAKRATAHQSDGMVFAPMPGLIVSVSVQTGEAVKEGQKLLVLEAMKTQQSFASPFDGTVEKVEAEAGTQVNEGDLLVIVTPLSGD